MLVTLGTVLLCAALIGIDQLLKFWAVQNLAPIGTMPLIPHVMELRYVENDGAAFSLFSGMQPMLIVFTGIVLLGFCIVLLFRRPKKKLEYAAVLLIFAGGVGNFVDRVANGYVVDYLAPTFVNFAVFNFADILVVVGVCLLLVAVFRSEWGEYRRKKQEGPEDTSSKAPPAETAHGED